MNNAENLGDYLVLSRGQWDRHLSAETIQRAIDDFYHWHAGMVSAGKMLPGQRLGRDAKLVSHSSIIDGPYTEAKEVIGGYWFIRAPSLEEAARIAADNPTLACGLSFEIRPIEHERASAYQRTSETPAASEVST